MSYVETKAGTIKELPVHNTDFELACIEVLENFVDFPWDYMDKRYNVIDWKSKNKQVIFVNGKFYLIEYEVNNEDSYMDCFKTLKDGSKFFAMSYYNGGTSLEEMLARHLQDNEEVSF